MSTVKINQKNYEIPDMTFKHLPMIEKCGLSIFDLMTGKYIFSAVQVFTCIVAECSTDMADHLLEQHILGGGTVDTVYEAFIEAMNESSFFKKLLERNEKTESTPAESN